MSNTLASKRLVNLIEAAYAAFVVGESKRAAVVAQLKADKVRKSKKIVAAIVMPAAYKAAGVPLNEKGAPDRKHDNYSAAQRFGNRVVNDYINDGASSAQYEFDVPPAIAKAAAAIEAWVEQFETKAQSQARKAAMAAAK